MTICHIRLLAVQTMKVDRYASGVVHDGFEKFVTVLGVIVDFNVYEDHRMYSSSAVGSACELEPYIFKPHLFYD